MLLLVGLDAPFRFTLPCKFISSWEWPTPTQSDLFTLLAGSCFHVCSTVYCHTVWPGKLGLLVAVCNNSSSAPALLSFVALDINLFLPTTFHSSEKGSYDSQKCMPHYNGHKAALDVSFSFRSLGFSRLQFSGPNYTLLWMHDWIL